MKRAPQKAKRPCIVSSCKDFATNQGYCDKHQDKIRTKDRERGTAHQRGYDARWSKAREQFLAEHPLCVECRKKNYINPATVVDHIIPHKGDKVLFWDKTNWQSLCETHHNIKTATEDRGGWSPVARQVKANRDSVNNFKVGDCLLAATEYAQESLMCDDKTVFTVIEVHGKTVFVQDDEGNGGRLHHSHFKVVP
ncbi:HNH endonuclease [Acinetobacter sp. ANC 5045]|uniref:HNH endonuclease n=1 Tax=Acinetobacter sp. ANC 5045 TaxID=2529851 RepID=UPI00103F4136|nr:HNH endonuclease signature motif containing protein [Acinetobacter sp. ANC 5045]TCB18990.1 HNH endonuclease [Acinetobacter sp. ANC 5045]